jgi:mannose-6-phosphate isomerase-like protein (cupin superfamily)
MQLINTAALPGSERARLFEGEQHGQARVSFFVITYSEPGIGPELHRHPYDETWLVQKGSVLLQIGEEQAEAGPGDIATAPANTPHKFTSLEPAEVVCIHASPRLIQESLERSRP